LTPILCAAVVAKLNRLWRLTRRRLCSHGVSGFLTIGNRGVLAQGKKKLKKGKGKKGSKKKGAVDGVPVVVRHNFNEDVWECHSLKDYLVMKGFGSAVTDAKGKKGKKGSKKKKKKVHAHV
jgi:hypothetical protein